MVQEDPNVHLVAFNGSADRYTEIGYAAFPDFDDDGGERREVPLVVEILATTVGPIKDDVALLNLSH